MKKRLFTSVTLFAIIMFTSLSVYGAGNDKLIIRLQSDPDQLNPVTSYSYDAAHIYHYIFQPLIAIDYRTLQPVAVLAESLPVAAPTAEGGLKVSYRIRQEGSASF